MKKRILAVILLVVLTTSLVIINKEPLEVKTEEHWVSNNLDGDYNILEVVTSEKQQKLSYMISGYEPVDLNRLATNFEDLYKLVSITKTFDVTGSRYSEFIPVVDLTVGEIDGIYKDSELFSQLGYYQPSLDETGEYKANFFPYDSLSTVYELTENIYTELSDFGNNIYNYDLINSGDFYYKAGDDLIADSDYLNASPNGVFQPFYYNGLDFISYDESMNASDAKSYVVPYYKNKDGKYIRYNPNTYIPDLYIKVDPSYAKYEGSINDAVSSGISLFLKGYGDSYKVFRGTEDDFNSLNLYQAVSVEEYILYTGTYSDYIDNNLILYTKSTGDLYVPYDSSKDLDNSLYYRDESYTYIIKDSNYDGSTLYYKTNEGIYKECNDDIDLYYKDGTDYILVETEDDISSYNLYYKSGSNYYNYQEYYKSITYSYYNCTTDEDKNKTPLFYKYNSMYIQLDNYTQLYTEESQYKEYTGSFSDSVDGYLYYYKDSQSQVYEEYAGSLNDSVDGKIYIKTAKKTNEYLEYTEDVYNSSPDEIMYYKDLDGVYKQLSSEWTFDDLDSVVVKTWLSSNSIDSKVYYHYEISNDEYIEFNDNLDSSIDGKKYYKSLSSNRNYLKYADGMTVVPTLYCKDSNGNFILYDSSLSVDGLYLYYSIGGIWYEKDIIDCVNEFEIYDSTGSLIDIVGQLTSDESDNLYYCVDDEYYKKSEVDKCINLGRKKTNYIMSFSEYDAEAELSNAIRWIYYPATLGREYTIDVKDKFAYIYKQDIQSDYYTDYESIEDKDSRFYTDKIYSTEEWLSRNKISWNRDAYEKKVNVSSSLSEQIWETYYIDTELKIINKDYFRNNILVNCNSIKPIYSSSSDISKLCGDINTDKISYKVVTFDKLTQEDIAKADLIYYNTSENLALEELYLNYNKNDETWVDYECDINISPENALSIYDRIHDRTLNVIYDDNSFMSYTINEPLTSFQMLYILSNMLYPNVAYNLELINSDTFSDKSLTYNDLMSYLPKLSSYDCITYDKLAIDNLSLQGILAEHNVLNTDGTSIFNMYTDIANADLTSECFLDDSNELPMYDILHNLIFHPVGSECNLENINLLEIQPMYSFLSDDCARLLIYGIDPYYDGSITVDSMSSKQLCTSKDSLTTNYDIIYIGSKYDLYNHKNKINTIALDNYLISLPKVGSKTFDSSSIIYGDLSDINIKLLSHIGFNSSTQVFGTQDLLWSFESDNYCGLYKYNLSLSNTNNYTLWVVKEGLIEDTIYSTYLSEERICSTVDLIEFSETIRNNAGFSNNEYWLDSIELDTSSFTDYGLKFIDSVEFNETKSSVIIRKNNTVITSDDVDNSHLRYKLTFKGNTDKGEDTYCCYIDVDFAPNSTTIDFANLDLDVNYEDDDLDSRIYVHSGDLITSTVNDGSYQGDTIYTPELGYRDTSYKTNTVTTRTSGADILKRNVEDIISFAESNKLVLASSSLKSDDVVSTKHLDSASNVYELLTNEAILSDSKLKEINLGDLNSIDFDVIINDYPTPYIDITSDYIELTDDGIKVLDSDSVYQENIKEYITNGRDFISYSDLGYSKEEIENGFIYEDDLSISFTIKSEGSLEDYSVKLYADFISDGVFSENEELKDFDIDSSDSVDELKPNKRYTISKDLSEDFSGFCHWKLVVFPNNTETLKYEVDGYTLLKDGDEREIVNILQILPLEEYNRNIEACSNGQVTSLNMGTELWSTSGTVLGSLSTRKSWGSYEITELSERENDILFREYISKLPNHEVHIWSMDESVLMQYDSKLPDSVNKYLGLLSPVVNSSNVPVSERDLFPNGIDFQDFDMIVIGFGDKGTYITQPILAEALYEFSLSGKPLILSDDVIGAGGYLPNYLQTKNYSSYYLTELFRDFIGQDRYGVASRYDEVSLSNLGTKEDPLNVIKYNILGSASDRKSYIDALWNKYDIPYTVNDREDMFTELHGYTDTILMTNIDDGLPIISSLKDVLDDNEGILSTDYITVSNLGQISFYPFYVCGDINISESHSQYWQLNLDNIDTTVWYTLGSQNGYTDLSNIDTYEYYQSNLGDGQNNYYLYTKGNVTYTGFGHSIPSSEDELKLFINTLLLSYKDSLSASKVEFLNDNIETMGNTSFMYLDYDVVEPDDVLDTNAVSINSDKDSIKLNFKISDSMFSLEKKDYIRFSLDELEADTLKVYTKDDVILNPIELVDKVTNKTYICYEVHTDEEYYTIISIESINKAVGSSKETEEFSIPLLCETFSIYDSDKRFYKREFYCNLVKRGLFNLGSH